MCMCVYLCGDMYLSTGTCRVQRCPIPEAGVTGGCERSEEGVGN